ncbi:MAG: ATP-binding cassette domain-containing protein [Myxococcales bacterium]|nr:ATP-binding cassette domain-containing protein [Myxococcales bacterium]
MIALEMRKELVAADGPMWLDLAIELKEGSLIGITGPSGAGKTTILRALSGLLTPESGRIRVGDELWYSSDLGVNLRPQQREVGLLFQDYALFPHMTVRQNLEFATRDRRHVDELLALVELEALADRFPETLSNGQKQRVALARAVVRRPKLLLLDEPLSGLDPQMRRRLQDELLRLHRRFELTTILVSHDLAEVFRLCERVVRLERGMIVADGDPWQLVDEHETSHKFSFIGEVVDIRPADVVFLAVVAVGQQLIELVLTADDRLRIDVGQQVLIGSKAFNPVVKPVGEPL